MLTIIVVVNNGAKEAKDGSESNGESLRAAPRSRLRTASNDNFSAERISRRRSSMVKMTTEQLHLSLAQRLSMQAARSSLVEEKEKVALKHRLSRTHRQSSITPEHKQFIAQEAAKASGEHIILEEDDDEDDNEDEEVDLETGNSRKRAGSNDVISFKEDESRLPVVTNESKVSSQQDMNKPTSPVQTITQILTSSRRPGEMESGKELPEPYCILDGFELYRKKKIIQEAVAKGIQLTASKKKELLDKKLKHIEPSTALCSCLPANQILPDHHNIKSTQDALHHASTFEQEFNSIYLFNRPVYYYRAVEFCIMFNCFYMSIWCTNMITISFDVDYDLGNTTLTQFIMIIPFVFGLFCLKFIAETASLLLAVSELNMEVVCKFI